MQLPRLSEVTLIKKTFRGIELQFRKAKLKDTKVAAEIAAEFPTNTSMQTIAMLASLLEGYTKEDGKPYSQEEKLEYLLSFEIDSVNELKIIDEILESLGMSYTEEKESQKKAK